MFQLGFSLCLDSIYVRFLVLNSSNFGFGEGGCNNEMLKSWGIGICSLYLHIPEFSEFDHSNVYV